ncbi:hypothetical protein SAMN05421786_103242 [Chryseobacterium ureilyticum]|uniref:Uncharacterized protein n=1 Tax=Chryseobacterium ureilyticum TaxID=373668 RepID=A0A1N7N6G1_9FLAO|nr:MULTISPECIES: hypothetical protein [Chryseobacterium]MDR6921218.1 hypothetical protein [Chryseobacterium sp. 2987]SIS93749.1 hypothetical protein SAMN05421786_103242 [Chryseobacterium ureilyticum]
MENSAELQLKETISQMVEKCLVADLKDIFMGKKNYKSSLELILDYEKYWNTSVNEISMTAKISKIKIQAIISETFQTIRKTYHQQPIYSDLSHIIDKYVNKLISDLNHTISNYLKEDIKAIKYKNSDDLKFIYENMINHYFIKTLNMKEKFAKGYSIEESLTEKVIHNIFYQLNKDYTKESNSSDLSLQSLLLKMENINTKKN